MSDTVEVAVVGAGRLGGIHARVLSQIPGVRISAVIDPDLEKASALTSQHGGTALPDVDSLENLPFAAVVATPTIHHHDVASRLLGRGVHVLVEKPITTTVADARKLIDLADSKGLTLMVGHSERFNPVIRALDRYRVEPRFIDAQRVSPFSFRSADIGVVLDMMIHDIDIILHLVKANVESVHAVGVPVIGRNEDIANARLIFENGAVANTTASRVALKTERLIRIFSPELYVTLDYQKKSGRIIRRGPALEDGRDILDYAAQGIVHPLEFMQRDLVRMEELVVEDCEPLRAEDEAFLHASRTRTPPPVTGLHGLRALDVAQRIVRSLEESFAKGWTSRGPR